MKWNAEAQVMGCGLFDNVIDGEQVESGTVFVQESMVEGETKGGTCWGDRGVSLKASVSLVREFGAKYGESLPGRFNVTYEMAVGRKSQVITVLAIEPLGRQTLPKAA